MALRVVVRDYDTAHISSGLLLTVPLARIRAAAGYGTGHVIGVKYYIVNSKATPITYYNI